MVVGVLMSPFCGAENSTTQSFLSVFESCTLGKVMVLTLDFDVMINFRYPASGLGASFKAFKVHAPGVHSVCFLDKGVRSQQVISVGGKDRCVAQVMMKLRSQFGCAP